MSTQNERELFEAWYQGDGPTSSQALEKTAEGNYKYMGTHSDWTTWSQARAPLLSRIAELEKQVAEFETKWDETDAALAEAESRIDALSKDAERLDWVADRKNMYAEITLPKECVERNIHSLRDAIDDAMMNYPITTIDAAISAREGQ